MLKKMMVISVLLLLCCSCVSRTTNKEPGLRGTKTNSETKIVWFWDKDF